MSSNLHGGTLPAKNGEFDVLKRLSNRNGESEENKVYNPKSNGFSELSLLNWLEMGVQLPHFWTNPNEPDPNRTDWISKNRGTFWIGNHGFKPLRRAYVHDFFAYTKRHKYGNYGKQPHFGVSWFWTSPYPLVIRYQGDALQWSVSWLMLPRWTTGWWFGTFFIFSIYWESSS